MDVDEVEEADEAKDAAEGEGEGDRERSGGMDANVIVKGSGVNDITLLGDRDADDVGGDDVN